MEQHPDRFESRKFCCIQDKNIHFLDLPFYKTATAQKLPIGPKDVAAVRKLLKKVRPQMLFAAGDISDPHGTHQLCLKAVLAALEEYSTAENHRPDLWLYRGAWQERPPEYHAAEAFCSLACPALASHYIATEPGQLSIKT